MDLREGEGVREKKNEKVRHRNQKLNKKEEK